MEEMARLGKKAATIASTPEGGPPGLLRTRTQSAAHSNDAVGMRGRTFSTAKDLLHLGGAVRTEPRCTPFDPIERAWFRLLTL